MSQKIYVASWTTKMTPKLILEGLEHWNTEQYFEAHECWETYWHSIRKEETNKEEADYVKGMIQLTVALVHHQRGNMRWYEKLMLSGPELLSGVEPYAEVSRRELITVATKVR